MKPCQFCSEPIEDSADLCPYCRREQKEIIILHPSRRTDDKKDMRREAAVYGAGYALGAAVIVFLITSTADLSLSGPFRFVPFGIVTAVIAGVIGYLFSYALLCTAFDIKKT